MTMSRNNAEQNDGPDAAEIVHGESAPPQMPAPATSASISEWERDASTGRWSRLFDCEVVVYAGVRLEASGSQMENGDIVGAIEVNADECDGLNPATARVLAQHLIAQADIFNWSGPADGDE